MRLVYLALGWAAGILLAANTPLRLPPLWLALAVVAILAAWRIRRIEAAAVLLLALGGLRMATTPATSALAAYNDLGGMTVEGVVVGEPDRHDDHVLLRVAAESVTRAGATTPTEGVMLVSAPPETNARYGDYISATGLLLTPGKSDRFSYADYLARGGVYSIMEDTAVAVTERATGNDVISQMINLKASAAAAINAALPEPQAGLLVGMLLGNQRGIAPDVSDAFARTGAAHVIAISGFNMAVLSGVVIGGLRRLRVRPIPAALISIGVIGAYTLLVGANPAVVRAALMSGLLVVGRALRRETYLPASLAFAALTLSALNPLILWDVSFQLSFFATLGLALFAVPFERGFHALLEHVPLSSRRVLDILLTEPLIVSLAALVFTLPLTMLYFGQFSPAALLINALILPVQPALLLLGGAATLGSAIVPPIAQALFWLDLLPLSWTIDAVRVFARLPASEVFISPNLIAAFFIITLGAALIKAAQPRWSLNVTGWVSRRLVVGAALASGVGLILLIGALLFSRPDGLLHVWMLDMGGSNAVLIATPRGAHLLIDGGRFPSRLLTALGDHLPFNNRSLDVLFLTQPDEAQFGALPTVLDRYELGIALTTGQPNLNETYTNLMAKLSPGTVVNVLAGYTLETDEGVRIEVLHPAEQPTLGDSLDESALVLRLTYDDVQFLFTSDLSVEGQQALLASGQDLRAAVLQVPHELDADFLKAVQPRIAVTQVDEPDEDDVAALDMVVLYRTSDEGTIHLSSDGTQVWVGRDTFQ